MEELFGKLLTVLIPWLLPLVLLGSFLVNTRTPKGDGKGGEGGTAKKAVKAKGEGKTEAKSKAPSQTEATKEEPSLSADITDSDMTE